MKKLSLFLVVALTFLNACSDDDKSNSPKSPNKKVEQKVEDLKYAGAVLFEVGTTTKAFDSEHMKPVSRIYVCVDRSGKTSTGKFDVDFASLGVAPYRIVSQLVDTNEVTAIWDLLTLTVNYEFSGNIEERPAYAWGEVNFKSTTSDRKWKHVYPDDGASRNAGDDGMDLMDLFQLETDSGSLIAGSKSYYEVDGVTYYISATLLRFLKNPDFGTQPIVDCESQNQPVFVKTGNDLKPN